MSGAQRHERLDMGLSRADFERVFPRLVAPASLRWDARQVAVQWADGRHLRVALSPERERRIASLRLPCLDLHFVFTAFTPDAATAFIARFDRAFHKGGG